MIGAVIFGSVYCLAWNVQFPTTFERTLWRVSALTAAFAPLPLPFLVTWQQKSGSKGQGLIRPARRLLVPILGFLYLSARLCVIGLTFASLRVMTEEVYTDTWTRYLISIH